MNLELYRIGCGTVYYPTGEPTLSVAANFGARGDSFATKAEAVAYFEAAAVGRA